MLVVVLVMIHPQPTLLLVGGGGGKGSGHHGGDDDTNNTYRPIGTSGNNSTFNDPVPNGSNIYGGGFNGTVVTVVIAMEVTWWFWWYSYGTVPLWHDSYIPKVDNRVSGTTGHGWSSIW